MVHRTVYLGPCPFECCSDTAPVIASNLPRSPLLRSGGFGKTRVRGIPPCAKLVWQLRL